jgi:antitoxin component HigA of HigAB toxin-antitoxin module
MTPTDYQSALDRISDLMDFDPEPDSAEWEELSRLCSLIEQYDEAFYPDPPSPQNP